ncbi:glutaredoxin domain-containing protein [Nocardia arthritidis]|uniref:NrdH-redoxin n=1 Tax=Nocardia arthritidis TaxID=228602 RepID=A0A6G9YT13_9NOCA|nr:glutaredoxin domain-containing protein [Nocardia arthritidis]QIS16465.1 NrdH-redoxin [Nocardia arthritidis]
MTDLYYDITVYTKDNCQPCKATKIYLMKHGIPFAEINTSRNPQVQEALTAQGYKELPVVEWNVNGKQGAWSGFRPDDIEALRYLVKGDH